MCEELGQPGRSLRTQGRLPLPREQGALAPGTWQWLAPCALETDEKRGKALVWVGTGGR
jgi:hypothetical protein